MSGHGHVTPNADGSRARCGGPGICAECSCEAGVAYLLNTSGPRVNGIGRAAITEPMDERTIEVYFDRRLSDDEMRALHEYLRRFGGEARQ